MIKSKQNVKKVVINHQKSVYTAIFVLKCWVMERNTCFKKQHIKLLSFFVSLRSYTITPPNLCITDPILPKRNFCFDLEIFTHVESFSRELKEVKEDLFIFIISTDFLRTREKADRKLQNGIILHSIEFW